MKIKPLVKLSGLMVILVFAGHAPAQGRCPSGESGCTMEDAATRIRDRAQEGARNVINNENPSGRAREVRETLRDCVECGIDAIRDGMNRIDNSSSGSAVK